MNRVNDQVWKRQKRISNAAEDGEEHSMICVNVYGCNNGISSIHGKELAWTIVIPSRIQNTRHIQTNVRHLQYCL